MKGFPVWQMVVISIIRVSEPITFTSLFPYVFFMIRDFEIAPTPADIAKYSGYLSASFAFCQFLCCVQWGKASDKYGRKPILLCGLAGTALSILIFGFSQNFWVAMFARSLMGSLNGNIAVLRTAIGEIATHRNHQSIAFSTLPLLWNFGAVIGPIIGGSKYLTRPKKRNDDENSLYNRFMNRFPYALSNIVIASILVFSLIVGFLFLEETQERARKKRDIGLEIGDFILTKLGFEVPTRPWQKKRIAEETNEEQTNLISEPQPFYNTIDGEEDDDDESDDSPKFIGPMTRRYSDALVRRYSSAQLGPVLTTTTTNNSIISTNIEQKFTSDIFTAAVVQTIIVNFLLSFHNIVYSEFLPVMLAGQVMPEKSKFPLKIVGGFGYDSDTIGTLLSFTGLVGTLSVMFIFPVLDRNYKTITSLRASQILFPLAYPILPYLIFTLRAYKSANPPWLTKYLLYGMCCIMTASNAIGFPNILVLIHRAAAPQHRAFINGTALSLNSLARFLGPMIWGYVMTLSEKFEVGELSWVLLGFLALVCSFYTFVMKDYEEDDEIVQESV
ncbi:hypothetical protein SBY92_005278 [Candida maltosa Xu316]